MTLWKVQMSQDDPNVSNLNVFCAAMMMMYLNLLIKQKGLQ